MMDIQRRRLSFIKNISDVLRTQIELATSKDILLRPDMDENSDTSPNMKLSHLVHTS